MKRGRKGLKGSTGRPLKHEADRIGPVRMHPMAAAHDQDTKKRKRNN